MLLPQTTFQPRIELRGSLVWFGRGAHAPKCLPCPLPAVSPDPFVWAEPSSAVTAGGPEQVMGKLVLGKLFSNVFPEQVWRACGISKIKAVQ